MLGSSTFTVSGTMASTVPSGATQTCATAAATSMTVTAVLRHSILIRTSSSSSRITISLFTAVSSRQISRMTASLPTYRLKALYTPRHRSITSRLDALHSAPSIAWWRGTVVERWSLTGELSLSCARPAADG